MEEPQKNDLSMREQEEDHPVRSSGPQISVSEFSCHCCYDTLVNPTTLNCGHSFCRHCLALWWMSSKKTECPECREKWEGFPKVNILLRDAIEKLFPDAIRMRVEDIQQNNDVVQSLAAFQKYGNDQSPLAPSTGRVNQQRGGGFFSGVLTALTGVAVILLVYHWRSRESEHGLLVHKAVDKWTTEEVVLWLEQLGPWASLYRDRFLSERVNGRLLLTLTEEEFSRAPYTIENSSHRRVILMELERVRALGVKPPQNLWEYKAVNPGRSLFLLYALKSSPRLGLLYLYLFDYTDSFLPFIHTICPLQEDSSGEDIFTKLLDLREPTWKQWREFLVKYSFLPYQLIAEFAWDWLEVHYWTSRFLIVNAMLLSVLELFSFWRIWSRSQLKTVPQRMWSHFWKVSTQGLFMAMFWPLIPQFVCNCLFYWALYFNPIINIDLVVKEVRRLENPSVMIGSKAPREPMNLPDIQAVTFKETRNLFLPLVMQGAASVHQGFNQVPLPLTLAPCQLTATQVRLDSIVTTQPVFLQGLKRLRLLWPTEVKVLNIIWGDMLLKGQYRLGVIVHTLNLNTRKTDRWIFEFKTRVVCRVSSKIARAT